MCLHPCPVEPVPEATDHVARAAFPKGNTYMKMKDELGAVFDDESFAHLFPDRGRAAFSPWRLALVTIMQFAEGLSDRQAADAVRGRIDWKFSLSLELEDPGFDASVLCEFRARLLAGSDEQLLFDTLLDRLRERGLIKARGRQRTDSTRVLASVRELNRLELAGRTMKQALEALAVAAPEWLTEHAPQEWASRYHRRFEEYRLPKGQQPRREEAQTIGADGYALLDAVGSPNAPEWLRRIPAVETLRRIWVQQYRLTEGGVIWRRSDEDGMPPATTMIESPVDPEAHYSKRNNESWTGYLVHITETCDENKPNIITNVETTPAPSRDAQATPLVHEALEAKGLMPATHVVDTGYVDANLLIESREHYGVDLLGPMRSSYRWQENSGFDQSNFELDWENEVATCPEGKKSISWRHSLIRGKPVIRVAFSGTDCGACPSRDLCMRRKARSGNRQPYRELTLVSGEHHEALTTARERESTTEYADEYAKRQGIEATISRALRTCEMRRTRYLGQTKAHLGHLLIASAVNFVRAGEWFSGKQPVPSRTPAFVRLLEPANAA